MGEMRKDKQEVREKVDKYKNDNWEKEYKRETLEITNKLDENTKKLDENWQIGTEYGECKERIGKLL